MQEQDEMDQLFNDLYNKNKKPKLKQAPSKPPSKQTLMEGEFEKIKKIKMTRENLYQNINVSTSDKNQIDALAIVKHWIDDDKFYQDKIFNKGFLLVKYEKPAILTNQKVKVEKTPMKNTITRQRKTLSINVLEYNQLVPFNTLWQSYMTELLGNDKSQESIYQKILKADLNGALIQICHAKCKSYEGLEGIVIEEKLKSFVMVTQQNRKLCISLMQNGKVILKQNSIFLLPLFGQSYTLYGCHLVYRAADRIKVRFKYHKATQFVQDHL